MQVNLLIIFLLTLLVSGCGATTDEEIEDAIVSANQFLSNKKCNEALRILESVGAQMSNPDWVSSYSSAQACLADWNVVRFFETDLDLLNTASEKAIIGSLSRFTQANMSSATDPAYINLRSAINTLLNAGNVNPVSYVNRANAIGAAAASNLAIQTLYMQLSQLGKFSLFYGNANPADGSKGGGSGTNQCYLTYTDATAKAFIDGVGLGTCDDTDNDTGRAELNGNRERMCEGIVLFNNFVDIIGNITIQPGDNNGNLDDLDDLSTDIEAECSNSGLGLGGTCTVKTQSICVANADGQYNIEHLERYYAVIWEGLHQ